MQLLDGNLTENMLSTSKAALKGTKALCEGRHLKAQPHKSEQAAPGSPQVHSLPVFSQQGGQESSFLLKGILSFPVTAPQGDGETFGRFESATT